MPQVCEVMQYELDNFRDTSLTELMVVIPGENDQLQDLIASVFHYWLPQPCRLLKFSICVCDVLWLFNAVTSVNGFIFISYPTLFNTFPLE